MAYTQDDKYLTLSTPLGADALHVRRLRGQESISTPFTFELDLESEDAGLDFAAVVGQGATVTLDLADGSQRFIHGVVSRFVQAGRDARMVSYRMELRPWLWLLTLNVDCRIFQNKTTPQIVEAVFQNLGFTDFRGALTGSYEPREYCVQYDESSFAFVSRLLEEEGICYFFEHADGVHTLVLGDDLAAFESCPGAASVRYGEHGQWTQQNVIARLTVEEAVTAGAAAVDDFNFETPSTDLIASATSTLAGSALSMSAASRRIYRYPGHALNQQRGEAVAGLRMEEHELPAKRLTGESFCRPFTSGYAFELKDYFRTEVNAKYVLRTVIHQADETSYSNAFEAFPATLPFRPPRLTPWPRIAGTQTAIVVGKAGEEIWTDEYGRVKVQFHWDQEGQNDENSSCWIRVAHGWAGKAWGWITIPRVGQEVVVSFLEGNPDRPLITGSVYNSEQTVPYALPGEQTKSTWKSDSSKGSGGYNEVRFEDLKDSEEVYIHAQKDENIVVENDKTESVGHDETITIGNDRIETVKHDETIVVENDRTELVKHDESLEVENDRTRRVGNNESVTVEKEQTITVNADRTVAVEKNERRTITKDQTIDVQGERSATVGKNDTLSVTQSLKIDAGTEIILECGSAKLELKSDGTVNLSGMNVTITGSGNVTVDASGNLTLGGAQVITN